MLFWIREIAGWMLVVVALAMIALGVRMVSSTQIVEATAIMFAALGVLRMGVLLVRVSTAARICMNEHRPLPDNADAKRPGGGSQAAGH